MPQSLLKSASAFALALGFSTIAFGQPAPTQEWSTLTFVQIKPDFRQEFEAAQKEITAAYTKAGVPSRIVVQTLLGDLGEYISITPLGKFADMDGPTPLVKALGDAGSQRLLKRAGAYMVSIHRVATVAMNEISINTPSDNPDEYAEVESWRLFPGKGAAFTSFMKDDYLPAMKKADVANLWVSRPVFGGDLSERFVVRPLHKLAELDGGPITTKALGAEAAQKLAAKRSQLVESTHYSVVRVRPDLSHMPAPPAKPAN